MNRSIRSTMTILATLLAVGAAAQAPATCPGSPDAVLLSGTPHDEFGRFLAGAGDVDGDGFDDVIVGARRHRPGLRSPEGAAFVYLGSPSGLATAPAWSAVADGTNNLDFGEIVAGLGDINGDGFADVAVGDPIYCSCVSGISLDGRVYVFHGGPAGPSPVADRILTGAENDGLGAAVVGAGDLNGDGFDDVAIAVLQEPLGQPHLDVYLGSPVGLVAAPIRLDGLVGLSGFHGLARVGDVNGDGLDDLLVGLPWFSNPESLEGALVLYLGSPSGIETTPAWTHESNVTNAHLGQACVGLGDLDGDGLADVAAAVPGPDPATGRWGSALVFRGRATGLEDTPSWRAEGLPDGAGGFPDGSGRNLAISGIGDVDCDGRIDLAVGVPGHDGSLANVGALAIYRGVPGGFSSAPDCTIEGGRQFGLFGIDVAAAGDINGDGASDFVVGASGIWDAGASGDVSVFLRNCAPTCTAPPSVDGACEGVRVIGSAFDADGDALTATWRSACAGTNFWPDRHVLDPVVSVTGECDATCELTLAVSDGRGGECSSPVLLTVHDRTPPVITPSEATLAELWSPNHAMSCLKADQLAPTITDACSAAVSWRFVGCSSSQPPDGRGDGHTASDCEVSSDGLQVCVRAERSGLLRAGRTYSLSITAADHCGNGSDPVVVGRISVPHDRGR